METPLSPPDTWSWTPPASEAATQLCHRFYARRSGAVRSAGTRSTFFSCFITQSYLDLRSKPKVVRADMNENATAAGVPSASPTVDAYDQLNAEVEEAPLQPDFSVQAPVFESLGRWGIPTAADIPPALPASLLIPATLDEVKRMVADNVVNDGFMAILNKGESTSVNNFVFSVYFVPISNLFAALDALRSDVFARSAACQRPRLRLERAR